MSRGNRWEDNFLDDVHRHDFIKTLAEDCQKTGCQVPAGGRMEARRSAEMDAESLVALRRGCCLGRREIKREKLQQLLTHFCILRGWRCVARLFVSDFSSGGALLVNR